MKQSIFFFVLFLSINGFPQISIDFQTSACYLYPIKLNNSDTKYFENDWSKFNSQNQFSLYNLDGSLYKTIVMPPKPDTSAIIQEISNISESLFDNDSSNIEYLVSYYWDSSFTGLYKWQVNVNREDGTILLNEVDAMPYFLYTDSYGVANTELGNKLILYYRYANLISYQTKVFRLPGKMPNDINDKKNFMKNDVSLYPNPNNGTFIIDLHSKEGNAITVDLYTDYGKLIDTYKSNGTPIRVSNSGLSDGLYFLNTHLQGTFSTTKMIIKK